MTPKPEPLSRVKARTLRQYAAARKACVVRVWARAGWSLHHPWAACESCGRFVSKDAVPPSPHAGHVHERRARSLGGDPTDPAQCELICTPCHFNGPSGAHRKSERAEAA